MDLTGYLTECALSGHFGKTNPIAVFPITSVATGLPRTYVLLRGELFDPAR